MTECRRYGLLFCNSFMVFGVYYFMEIPVSLQNELMNNFRSHTGANNISNQTDCRVCLGLGEVRYNFIFSAVRWTSLAVCLPSGFVIDRLGNSRSVILFSILPLIGSVMFAVGATSHAPVTTPMYILMVAGYSLLAFGDGSLRFVQTRVISHCFPEATFIALAISSFGYCGQGTSLFLTPFIATTAGLVLSVWLAAVACGVGVMFAVILAFLLEHKTSKIAVDYQNNKSMTLKDLLVLPGRTYWLFITSNGFTAVCWLVKQANLPDFLKLRHGYTMTEASRITGIAPYGVLLSPVVCFVLARIDCDGIITTMFQSWMLVFYALLGFRPDFNIIIIALADGIGIELDVYMDVTKIYMACVVDEAEDAYSFGTPGLILLCFYESIHVLSWQLLVDLCPAPYIGTLGGVMFFVRNTVTAFTFVVSGYILKRDKTTDAEEELDGYHHLFLMLILLSSNGVICGVMMNVLDTHKTCALNSRIARWKQSNTETIGLISMTEPSSQYCGTGELNPNRERDDRSVTSTCKED